MCFCFDGENALRAYRPDDCRDRLPGASARALVRIASRAGLGQRDADGLFKPGDTEHDRRLAVLLERMY
ncbi:MAG: hypothetical protein E5V89_07610 [Mesorhizobium sp.]|uniref:hypothetical protein n=1 Tax=Mesorhizobium sp. TaxID=1871066 RepID=UPI000FE6BD70|nr:hypothetical protein [Mesorhizobium sp.]RWD65024.1 MAG: hypothetical protein EOS36_08555 [Mesorhizobium sp.]RWE50225.1 MAG: hypothetical protein EOS79_06410 [Mesorhizobium sp.]TIV71976.1 MAG: hypothetical protein E5V89_07610 [Mesorhizobium sp.]